MTAAGSTGAGAGITNTALAAGSTILFVVIAVLALLTVIGILWGIRLKAGRKAAAVELEERAREAESAGPTEIAPAPPQPAPLPAAPPPSISQSPASPVALPPVAPPPPVIDGPGLGTPMLSEQPLPKPVVRASTPIDLTPAPDGSLTQLKGLGPKVQARLAELGITTVGQIAALDAGAAQALDARLGAFTGRMGRDRWIEQARFLAAGDVKGFEAVFGRL